MGKKELLFKVLENTFVSGDINSISAAKVQINETMMKAYKYLNSIKCKSCNKDLQISIRSKLNEFSNIDIYDSVVDSDTEIVTTCYDCCITNRYIDSMESKIYTEDKE